MEYIIFFSIPAPTDVRGRRTEAKKKRPVMFYFFNEPPLPPSFRRYTCTRGETKTIHSAAVSGCRAQTTCGRGRRRRFCAPSSFVSIVVVVVVNTVLSSYCTVVRQVLLPYPPPHHHRRHHWCLCGMNRVRHGTVASRCVQIRAGEKKPIAE